MHSLFSTLRAFAVAIEARDPHAVGHAERTALLSAQLAHAVGMSNADVSMYQLAGLLHDVGKLAVPEAVLTKAAKLSSAEIVLVQQHARIGAELLADVPALAAILPGIRHHHERNDGFGYPDGLAGEAIPHLARVLALADSFDAMSCARSYREAMPRAVVLEEIARCAGTQFDPSLTRVFLSLDFREYDELQMRAAAVAVAA